MEVKELAQEHFDVLKEYLCKNSNGETEISWQYSDKLNSEQIVKIINGKRDEVENEIWEMQGDHVLDLERDMLKQAIKNCNLQEFVTVDDCEPVYDFLTVNIDIETLIKNTGTINVRFSLFSNYDCINSFWLESQSGYSYEESYFGAVIDALQVNPSEMKKKLVEKNVRTRGKWITKKRNPYVDVDMLYRDLENQSCGACLLVAVGTLDLSDIEKAATKFIIPKGNNVGFYSSWQGGGSLIETPLLRDLVIDTKKYGKTEYDHWGLRIDIEDDYSIESVYGVTKKFWGKPIKPI